MSIVSEKPGLVYDSSCGKDTSQLFCHLMIKVLRAVFNSLILRAA